MATDPIVIAGAGMAGGKTAELLRERGFSGRVVLLGTESHLPYERPPLSKEYLAGRADRASFQLHDADWYRDHSVELRLGATVTKLDRAKHSLTLADGSRVDYAKLILATGSSPRRLPVPGADAAGVRYLRTLDDSERLKELFASIRRLAVVGAGWIGLEVTAAAREAGVEVTVLDRAERPLFDVLGPELGEVFQQLHTEHGVTFRLGARIDAITTADGAATGVSLADGEPVPADAVLVGIGATPNTALAEQAGLPVDDGVLVDTALRTDDPDIFAVGDIANAPHPFYGKRIRVEHWANALYQPETVAATVLGEPAEYTRLPYFFSDQYDLGMEYQGLAAPGEYDRVVFRGDVAEREFIAFWLSAGRVVAGMNVNIWDVTGEIEQLIRSRRVVDPALLGDPAVALDSLLS